MRPHDFQVVFFSDGHSPFNEGGSVYLFVANNLNKELLESWWGKDTQQLDRRWPRVPESMDGTSRDQDKGSNSTSDCLFSYLDVDLSLQNIECLFLGFVDMLWRPFTRYDLLKGMNRHLHYPLSWPLSNRMARYLNYRLRLAQARWLRH